MNEWDKLTEFEFNGPYTGKAIDRINGVILPQAYIDFMKKHNGGEGDLGETWFVLYRIDELEVINNDLDIDEDLPGSIIIGSNGGGELYGVNSNGDYFNVPEIIEKEYVEMLGNDFNSLPSRINNLWKD